MRYYRILAISAILMFFAGCSDNQLQKADWAAEVTQQVTQQGDSIVNSPVGQLIPEPIRTAIKLGGLIALIAAGSWQEFRRKTAETAVKQIVAGAELLRQNDESSFKEFAITQSETQSATTEKMVRNIKTA